MAISTFRYDSSRHAPIQSQKMDGGWEDVLPGVGGFVGSLLQPEGLLPGAITGGGLAGVGETARQGIRALTGRGFDASQIGKSAGENAAYGAIPLMGGQVLKAYRASRLLAPLAEQGLKGTLARTGARAGTGFLAGSMAQEIQNQGSQDQRNPLISGALTGAINTLIPGATGFSKWVGKGPISIGSKMAEAAQGALERKGLPSKDVLQKLFGGRAIDTMGGRDLVNPEVAQLIKEGNLPIPPQGSTQGLLPAIEEHQKVVEAQLKPILESHVALTKDVQELLKEYQYKYAPNDRKFFGQLPQKVQSLINSDSKQIDLYTLKKIQRDLGDVANWNPNLPSTPLEKYAQDAYDGIDSIIQQELGRTNNAISQSLNKQHSLLIAAKGNVKGFLKKGWPDEFRSESLGFAKRMSGTLSALRENENAMRALAGAGITGTQFLPTPEPIKLAMQLAEAGLVAPFAFPQTGSALNKVFTGVGKGMQAPDTRYIQRALQQLGVRAPSLGQ